MDFLKIIIPLFLLSLWAPAAAQNNLITAFGKSYELEQEEKYTEAATILEAVNEKNNNGYEINLRLGWLKYLGGNYDQSVNYYRKALSIRPYCIEARFGLVLPLTVKNQWDEILNIYHEILEIDPQNTKANYQVGVIYYHRGQFEKADAHLKKVVNLYPFDYDSLLMLAWTKLKMGQISDAKVLFNKVLLYDPQDESAQQGLDLLNSKK